VSARKESGIGPKMAADLAALARAGTVLPKYEQATLLGVLGIIAVLDANVTPDSFMRLVHAAIEYVSTPETPTRHDCADPDCPWRGFPATFDCNTGGQA
jgi:hypothetical protein